MSLPDVSRQNHFSGRAFLRRKEAVGAPKATLVLVHGLGESGLCFERIWNDARLAPYTILSWDLPGYGKSAWAERPFSIQQHADFVRQQLDATPRASGVPTVLVGHSMGGVIGQYLCEDQKSDTGRLVDRLINVEGNISMSDCTQSAVAAAQSVKGWCARGQDDMADVLYLEGVKELPSRTYYASVKMCDPATFHLNATELVDLSRREELAERLGKLDVETHYVLGDPGGAGTHSQGLLRDAGVPVHGVSHSGHWPFVDNPEEFLSVLLNCLDT